MFGRGRRSKQQGSTEQGKKSCEPTHDDQLVSQEQTSKGGSVVAKKKNAIRKKAKTPEKVEKSSKFIKSARKKKTKYDPTKPEESVEQPKEPASSKGYSQAATEAMEKYRKDIMRQTGKTFRDEWQQIQGTRADDLVPATKLTKSFESSVPCIESTRLKAEGVDFYHANMFKMPDAGVKDPRFILAQVPSAQGIEDFWQAVFQAEPCLLFILTPLYENGRGCESFFPVGVGEQKNFGAMMVRNKKEEKFEFGTSFTFEILPDGCSNALMLRTVHFEQWAQNATPHFKGILSMMQTCRYDAESTAPIVCVSRKGTGRAGVLAAAVIVYNRLIQGNFTPLVDVVTTMRKQRAGAVDNIAQYAFITSVITCYIKKRGGHPSRWDEAKKHIYDCSKDAEALC